MAKKWVFSLHQNAGRVFYSPKNSFLLVLRDTYEFLITWPAFWCRLKNLFFLNFSPSFFFAFFQLFSTKNTENDYLDQHLGKTWSKYTKWVQYNDHLKTKSSHFAWDLSDQKCCDMAQIVKRQIVEWEVTGSNLGRG